MTDVATKRKPTSTPLKKKPHTIHLPPELHADLMVEAARLGMPWTTLAAMLLREAIDARRR